MRLRHATIMAGLACGPASWAAQAAPITYYVNYADMADFNTFQEAVSATGTITTDGNLGPLSASDITGYDLVLTGSRTDANGTQTSTADLTQTNSSVTVPAGSLNAVDDRLLFVNGGSGTRILDFSDGQSTLYYIGVSGSTSVQVTVPAATLSTGYGSADFVIGTSVTPAMPLPASAPMFGAAILGLAGLGYMAKRKKAVAA